MKFVFDLKEDTITKLIAGSTLNGCLNGDLNDVMSQAIDTFYERAKIVYAEEVDYSEARTIFKLAEMGTEQLHNKMRAVETHYLPDELGLLVVDYSFNTMKLTPEYLEVAPLNLDKEMVY